ncbi:MAG: hypothetical protein K5989_06575 [Lachnospiraceae bacterium]|nr:hypothetical protein [Lachnospiraceae bacterium]
MSQNQQYPFERNRYYPGKMLTSADFQAEQNYYINKNHFLNGLLYGSGIVCGLGVFSLDDISILIESGVAFDGTGREIVVDNSVVKKLSSIEGFDRLKGNTATLKIRYQEKDIHSVYAVGHKDNEREYEYNRISEGYEIFLTEQEVFPSDYNLETEFLVKETFFQSENYVGEVMLPNTVCIGGNVKIVLEIRKISSASVKLSCRGILETPVFLTPEESHEIEIGVEDLSLQEGESVRREYWVEVQDSVIKETDVILRSGSGAAYEDDVAITTVPNFVLKVRLSYDKPLKLVGRDTGRVNLEMREMGLSDIAIPLADIRLVRDDNSYLIESIHEKKHFVMTPAQELMRNEFLSYYQKNVDIRKGRDKSVSEGGGSSESRQTEFTNIATGTLEIPLGKNAREGDIRYSGEIAHGLGTGNVFVQVGYDYVSDRPDMGLNQKSTIYGNPDFFSDRNNGLVNVETAVKILNEKGTFVVAVKLLRDVDFLVLTFRWVAVRFPAGDDFELTEADYDKSISVDTPTVIMGAKESHFFGVRFHNMKKCSITYELTAPGSGEISSDGTYTAPSKDGVYEIRIYCSDMPVICTYAYAIVRKQLTGEKVDANGNLEDKEKK